MKKIAVLAVLTVAALAFFLGCVTTKTAPSMTLEKATPKPTPVAEATATQAQPSEPERIVGPPELTRAEKPEGPAELTTVKKAEIRIIYDPSLNLAGGPVRLSQKQSVVKAQAQTREGELFPYAHTKPIWLRTFSAKGKAVEGSVPAGTLILYKCVEDEKTQIKTCVPKMIAQCGNRVDKFRLEFHPAKQVWVERYRDKETLKTTERYRDTITLFKKIILPPPLPLKESGGRINPLDYNYGGDGGGGSASCGGGSGASR